MNDQNGVSSISVETFIDAIFDDDLSWPPGRLRALLRTPQDAELLFACLWLYCDEHGALAPNPVQDADGIGEAALLLGKTIHVNLGRIVPDEIKSLLTTGAALVGAGLVEHNLLLAGAGAVISLAGKLKTIVTRLRKEHGEVCAAEYVQETHLAYAELGANAAMLSHALTVEPCRYPRALCRYEAGGRCTMREDSADAVLKSLEDAGVLQKITIEAPHEWKLAR